MEKTNCDFSSVRSAIKRNVKAVKRRERTGQGGTEVLAATICYTKVSLWLCVTYIGVVNGRGHKEDAL